MNLKHVNKPLSGQSCAFKQDRLVLANLHYIHCSTNTLQSRTGPVQGQKRNFPVKFSHTGKNIFSLQGTPFLITGISLWKKLHKENPVFITGKGFGINFFQWPHNKKGFSVCIYIFRGFPKFWFQGSMKSTVSGVFEDLKFTISECSDFACSFL